MGLEEVLKKITQDIEETFEQDKRDAEQDWIDPFDKQFNEGWYSGLAYAASLIDAELNPTGDEQ